MRSIYRHMTDCLINHHITGHLVCVIIVTEWVMVCPAINNPASCEICVVIRFLHANMSAAEIHRELCAVYDQNTCIMSEGTVRQWCRMFRHGWTNVLDEEWSDRPSLVCDDLIQSVDKEKNVKDDASQFQKFHVTIHKFYALFSTRLSQLG
jgi:transposase